MITINLLWLIMLGEFVLLAGGGVLFLLLRNATRRAQDRRAVATLVKNVTSDRERRDQEMHDLLSERFGLSGETLATAVRDIRHGELTLYQTFANLYRRRDSNKAATFNVTYESATAPYHELEVETLAGGADADADDTAALGVDVSEETGRHALDPKDLERLRDENARLAEELRVTMDTMGRMLNEYSTLFGDEKEASSIDKERIREMFDEDSEPEGSVTTASPEAGKAGGAVEEADPESESAEETAFADDHSVADEPADVETPAEAMAGAIPDADELLAEVTGAVAAEPVPEAMDDDDEALASAAVDQGEEADASVIIDGLDDESPAEVDEGGEGEQTLVLDDDDLDVDLDELDIGPAEPERKDS